MTISPGDRVGGVSVERALREGPHRRLLLGTQRATGKAVLVKIISGPEAPGALERGRRLRGVANPHLPQILEVGSLTDGEGGSTYWVMAPVEGRTLAQLIQEEAPLPPPRAAQLALHICQALDALHRAGLCHGDLRPLHVLVQRDRLDEQAVVISGGAGPMDLLTLDRALWISPEQVAGGPVDARSDIYQVGLLLFTLLTGQPPFSGHDPHALARQHLRMPPPDLQTLRPDLPGELIALVRRCLAKDPAGRDAQVDPLCRQLQPLVRARSAAQSISGTGLAPAHDDLHLPPPPRPERLAPSAPAPAMHVIDDPLLMDEEAEGAPHVGQGRADFSAGISAGFTPGPSPQPGAVQMKLSSPGELEDPLLARDPLSDPLNDPLGEDDLSLPGAPSAPLHIPPIQKTPGGARLRALAETYLQRQPHPQPTPARDDLRTPTPATLLAEPALRQYIEATAERLDARWALEDLPEDLSRVHDAIEQLLQAHARAMESWQQAWAQVQRQRDVLAEDRQALEGRIEKLSTDLLRAQARLQAHEASIQRLGETISGQEISFIEQFCATEAGEGLDALEQAYRKRSGAAESLAKLVGEARLARRQYADMQQQRADMERARVDLQARRWTDLEAASLQATEAAYKAQQIGAALEQRCMQIGLRLARHAEVS